VKQYISIIILIILSSCGAELTKELTPLGNKSYSNEPVGIYIVPVWGVDKQVISYLENKLSQQHKVRVKVTTDMGLDKMHFDEKHQQYVGETIHQSVTKIADSLRQQNKNTPFIVILNEDINSSEFRYRFLFSQHFSDKISVISLARIDPVNYGNAANPDLKASRALKLTNKALGYHMYDYTPSSDFNNVMYGPIMGLPDLDKVNTWYR